MAKIYLYLFISAMDKVPSGLPPPLYHSTYDATASHNLLCSSQDHANKSFTEQYNFKMIGNYRSFLCNTPCVLWCEYAQNPLLLITIIPFLHIISISHKLHDLPNTTIEYL